MFFTAFGDHVKHSLTQWHHFLLIKRWTPIYQKMKRLIIQTDHIGSLKHQNWFEYCHCFNLHIAIVVIYTLPLLIKRWTPIYQRMKRLIIQTDHIGSLKHQNWFENCHCCSVCTLPLRPSARPSRRATPRWSQSAGKPPATDTTSTTRTTARRSPRRLATTSPLSLRTSRMTSHRGVRPEAEEKCITVPELVLRHRGHHRQDRREVLQQGEREYDGVCQPNAGYDYHAYGHDYCKEVAQETCYNVPVFTVVEPTVDVIYPEPIKTCVNKPIDLFRISCEDLAEEKCITVPELVLRHRAGGEVYQPADLPQLPGLWANLARAGRTRGLEGELLLRRREVRADGNFALQTAAVSEGKVFD